MLKAFIYNSFFCKCIDTLKLPPRSMMPFEFLQLKSSDIISLILMKNLTPENTRSRNILNALMREWVFLF